MQEGTKGMVEFYGELKGETEKAYMFFDGANEIWLPKSMIAKMAGVNGRDYEVTVPEWLAKNKGII